MTQHTTDDDRPEIVLSEERLEVGTVTEQAGLARIRKSSHLETVHERVDRAVEHADTERVTVDDAVADSGEVETLPDGSLSIPVFEEEIVVTKRLVVRERVVVRKHVVHEEHVVTADLRRERVDVQAEGEVVVTEQDAS